MQLPRLITKTHTEALRPGNYSLLISKCSSPYKSSYPETVEKRLADFLKPSIAKYTVKTATEKNRGFGFLLDNMIWSWKGHVINAILQDVGKTSNNKDDYYDLTKSEKIAYLKYFLETEGALILKLSKMFQKRGGISYSFLKSEIQNIFKDIYESYIDLAPDFRTRIRIKQMFQETQKQMKSKKGTYATGTLPHKIKPHIQALADLGLLVVDKGTEEEIYQSSVIDGLSSLDLLSGKLQDFKTMEDLLTNEEHFSIIAEALNLKSVRYSPRTHKERLQRTFSSGYEGVKNKTTGMADIEALVDWCCTKLLSEQNILITQSEVKEFISGIRQVSPSSIQFHVDGKGRIAYLIMASK